MLAVLSTAQAQEVDPVDTLAAQWAAECGDPVTEISPWIPLGPPECGATDDVSTARDGAANFTVRVPGIREDCEVDARALYLTLAVNQATSWVDELYCDSRLAVVAECTASLGALDLAEECPAECPALESRADSWDFTIDGYVEGAFSLCEPVLEVGTGVAGECWLDLQCSATCRREIVGSLTCAPDPRGGR